jgi:peroxiredoxin
MNYQTTKDLDDARFDLRTNRIPAANLIRMDRATYELVASGIRSKAFQVGDSVKDFILMDAHGQPVRLRALLEAGPVVLGFYRGGWCPYCNIELLGFERIMPELQALSASVLAISPQLPDNSLCTEAKNSLHFPLLSDVGNVVARGFGIVFELPNDLLALYKVSNHELAKMNGPTGGRELPIPTTFILDRMGTVWLSFVDEDYTKRLNPDTILETLRTLQL